MAWVRFHRYPKNVVVNQSTTEVLDETGLKRGRFRVVQESLAFE
jgi:DNA-directed RNA polymerase subunit N (RpoN/RPB10)